MQLALSCSVTCSCSWCMPDCWGRGDELYRSSCFAVLFPLMKNLFYWWLKCRWKSVRFICGYSCNFVMTGQNCCGTPRLRYLQRTSPSSMRFFIDFRCCLCFKVASELPLKLILYNSIHACSVDDDVFWLEPVHSWWLWRIAGLPILQIFAEASRFWGPYYDCTIWEWKLPIFYT